MCWTRDTEKAGKSRARWDGSDGRDVQVTVSRGGAGRTTTQFAESLGGGVIRIDSGLGPLEGERR